MAYSTIISEHPLFSSFVQLGSGIYLNCSVVSDEGEVHERLDLTTSFARMAAVIYSATNALPVMGSTLGSVEEALTLNIDFIGYAVFGQDVLVTIGGTVEE